MGPEEHINVEKMLEPIIKGVWSPSDEILGKGEPIIYADDDTPEGHVLKEYPSGRIELIKVDMTGDDDQVVMIVKS
ncbi:MAG: hypothetical protein LBI57_05455 [Helicobacteraceae bacterium]|jgi:hypothetical protein|nr:hypothetical protein [Helicobacteraceae bacterium]